LATAISAFKINLKLYFKINMFPQLAPLAAAAVRAAVTDKEHDLHIKAARRLLAICG